MDALKPCPFCGEQATLAPDMDQQEWRGECLSCGGAGPVRHNKQLAAADWNRRVGEEPLKPDAMRSFLPQPPQWHDDIDPECD